MTEDRFPPGAPSEEGATDKPQTREERLAAKLRENLKKRKDQARLKRVPQDGG